MALRQVFVSILGLDEATNDLKQIKVMENSGNENVLHVGTFTELSALLRNAVIEQEHSNVGADKTTTLASLSDICVRAIVGRRRRVSRHLAFVDVFEVSAATHDVNSADEHGAPLMKKKQPVWLEVKLHSETLQNCGEDVRKLLKNGGPCSASSLIEIMGDAHAEKSTASILLVARSVRRLGTPAECVPPGALDANLLNSALDARGERHMLSWQAGALRAFPSPVPLRGVCRLWMQIASDLLLRRREASSPAGAHRLSKGGVCAKELAALLDRAAPGGVDAQMAAIGGDRVLPPSAEAAALRVGDACLPRCGLRHWWSSDRERLRAGDCAARRRSARLCAIADGDAHGGKARKCERAGLFAGWLEETFGARLRAGEGVLDVGGGRGDVAFELFNRRGVPCVLVEPRERALSRKQHRWLEQAPKQRRALCEHRRELFTSAYDCRGFSVVVGMHADEATELIVDAAIAGGVPFAVVPCCVFPKSNPGRRGPDGGAVTTTKEFVAYLCAKMPGIHTACLPFEGRNVVVFSNALS